MTFGVYATTSDEPLTAEKAFVALSLFNIIRFPMNILPQLVSGLVNARIAIKRISDFLVTDEIETIRG